jgi:hypothetical protein
MEAICLFETCADFQRTTRRYIPENNILLNHLYKNIKSYKKLEKISVTGREGPYGSETSRLAQFL